MNQFLDQASKLYREAGPGSPYQKMVNIYKKLRPASSGDKGPGYLDTLNRIRQERAKDLVTLWYQVRPSLAANSDYKEMAEFFDQVVAKIQWYYSYVDPSLPSGSQPGSKGWAWFSKPDISYEEFSVNCFTRRNLSGNQTTTFSTMYPRIQPARLYRPVSRCLCCATTTH